MNRKNTLLWVVLMLLMLFNFWLAEISQTTARWTLSVILIVTVIKFLGIAFQYMELKDAHRRWKIIFIVFVLSFAVAAGLV
ncbi:MAG: cytochrome C oxidase subunit IV family protein [Chlorobi bacterium]|nr:cytochrome C oxidase subunit IV family protein [Chlorobiota bacterium]